MAPTIITQKYVCDGYDVLLDDGSVIHFRSKPTDVIAALDAIIATREEPSIEYEIIGESGA